MTKKLKTYHNEYIDITLYQRIIQAMSKDKKLINNSYPILLFDCSGSTQHSINLEKYFQNVNTVLKYEINTFNKTIKLNFLIKERIKKKFKLLNSVIKYFGLNENKEYHPERNSLVHIKIVTARSIQYGDEILEKVALYHDMAKFDTVSFNPKGWPTSQGHDTAGAKLAEDPIVKYICANHMKVKSWVSKGEGSPAPLQPNTKLDVFNGTIDFPNPGQNDDEKAKNFWRLVVFVDLILNKQLYLLL